MLISLILSLLVNVKAHAWTKLIDCNHGEFVVDHLASDEIGRFRYQLVLRGRAFRYFLERKAYAAGNEKGEFIIPLQRNPGGFVGFEPVRSTVNPNLYRILRVRLDRASRKAEIAASIGGRFFDEQIVANTGFTDCE